MSIIFSISDKKENSVSEVDAKPAAVEEETPKPKTAAPSPPATESAPATNGTSLPDMDLAMLKEKSRASSRKKAPPQSNWNNRQAIFNNL